MRKNIYLSTFSLTWKIKYLMFIEKTFIFKRESFYFVIWFNQTSNPAIRFNRRKLKRLISFLTVDNNAATAKDKLHILVVTEI